MKNRVSLKDIADVVGVSASLVSYVLNNKGKENRVSEETAKKIREVAEELNYQPNQIARSLKSKRSQSIGLIVADISNPFFSNMARTIEDEAHSSNYTVIFGSSDENSTKLKKVLDFLTTRQVDGFIIAPTEGCKETVAELSKQKIPFVLIDRYFEDLSTNYVIIDNFQASMDAVDHLLKRGHTRIGLVAYRSELIHFRNRIRGYKEALKKAGVDPGLEFIKEVSYAAFEEEMKTAVRELIYEDKAEAIFFCTNTLAIEGLKQIFSLGRKVPEEIDVVAFDQSIAYDFFEYFIPHISQPIKEIGQEAVRALIEQINNKTEETRHICLRAKLEARQAPADELKMV
ncbi:MAG: LacI family DNA-binding transcriptional regulator [Phaeodactylibacter sp.]|nr:LacI family DNA-binding transcriptional regulator [Phaeodactylibacter sp.]